MGVAAMARRRDPGADLFPPQVLMDELKAKETALAEAEEAVKVLLQVLGWMAGIPGVCWQQPLNHRNGASV